MYLQSKPRGKKPKKKTAKEIQLESELKIPISKEETVSKKKEHYVKPEEFDAEIIKYYEEGGEINDKLGKYILDIATRLSFSPSFVNYTFRHDMVGDAVLKMMEALIGKKYTHEKGKNPFSYFTKIAFHCFLIRIKNEKKNIEGLKNYREKVYDEFQSENGLVDKNNLLHLEYNTHARLGE